MPLVTIDVPEVPGEFKDIEADVMEGLEVIGNEALNYLEQLTLLRLWESREAYREGLPESVSVDEVDGEPVAVITLEGWLPNVVENGWEGGVQQRADYVWLHPGIEPRHLFHEVEDWLEDEGPAMMANWLTGGSHA